MTKTKGKLVRAQYHGGNHVATALQVLANELNYSFGFGVEISCPDIEVEENRKVFQQRAMELIRYVQDINPPFIDQQNLGDCARWLLMSEMAARTYRIED